MRGTGQTILVKQTVIVVDGMGLTQLVTSDRLVDQVLFEGVEVIGTEDWLPFG